MEVKSVCYAAIGEDTSGKSEVVFCYLSLGVVPVDKVSHNVLG